MIWIFRRLTCLIKWKHQWSKPARRVDAQGVVHGDFICERCGQTLSNVWFDPNIDG